MMIMPGRSVSLTLWIFRQILRTVTKKIRVSLVRYLNSAPLGWAFLHGPLCNTFKVIRSSPSKCADQLARGEVEIGLIPSIEYTKIPGLRIIPGMSISSLNDVRSILLVQPKKKGPIRSIALDTTSRTSVVLTKVLMKDVMGIHPEFIPHPPNLKDMLKKCSAALLIGDAALRVNPDEYHTVDLAQVWVQWQRMPFVFAFWACRENAELPENVYGIFQMAKKWGLEKREEIADVFSKKLKLRKEFLEHYLFHNINFDLSPDHIGGLEKYYRLARDGGFITEIKPLQFLQQQ